jgi:hypothetical protein
MVRFGEKERFPIWLFFNTIAVSSKTLSTTHWLRRIFQRYSLHTAGATFYFRVRGFGTLGHRRVESDLFLHLSDDVGAPFLIHFLYFFPIFIQDLLLNCYRSIRIEGIQ